MAQTEEVRIDIDAKTAKANKKLKDFGNTTKKGSENTKKFSSELKGMAVQALAVMGAALAFRKLAGFVKESVMLYGKQEQAEVRLEAVLKSTGHAAGLSAEELKKMASAMQKATGVGDELVLEAQAMMLTFKNVNKDVFPETMSLALDMSKTLGVDLKSAVIQVGKSMNDPVLGMTALSRSGIQFTQTQKDMVKGFVAQNNIMGAQGVILDELRGQFGGVAEALGDTTLGAFDKLESTLGDFKEKIGEAFAPLLLGAATKATGTISKGLENIVKIRDLLARGGPKTQKALSPLVWNVDRTLATDRELRKVIAAFEKDFAKGLTDGAVEIVKALEKMSVAELEAVIATDELTLSNQEGMRWGVKSTQAHLDQAQALLEAKTKTEDFQQVNVFLNGVMEKLNVKTAESEALFGVWGDTAELNKSKSKALKSAIDELSINGFGPNIPVVKMLKEQYEALNAAIDKTSKSMDVAAAAAAKASGQMGGGAKSTSNWKDIFVRTTDEALRFEDVVIDIGAAMFDIFSDKLLDSIESVGAAFAEGSSGAEAFRGSLADMGLALIQALPKLLLMGGLQLLGTPAWGVGLVLIAASGLVALGAGFATRKAEMNAEEAAADADIGASFTGRSFSTSSVNNYYVSGDMLYPEQQAARVTSHQMQLARGY